MVSEIVGFKNGKIISYHINLYPNHFYCFECQDYFDISELIKHFKKQHKTEPYKIDGKLITF